MSYKYNYTYSDQPTYFSIYFGEGDKAVDIGRLVDGITDIQRNISTDSTIRPADREIDIHFVLKGDYRRFERARRELSRALRCGTKGAPLTFNDEPNLYYQAKPKGDITLTEKIGQEEATGSIKFTITESRIRSKVVKKLQSPTYTKKTSGANQLTVEFTRINDRVTLTIDQAKQPFIDRVLADKGDWIWSVGKYPEGYQPDSSKSWPEFRFNVYDSKGALIPTKSVVLTRGGGMEYGLKGNDVDLKTCKIGGTVTYNTVAAAIPEDMVPDNPNLGMITHPENSKSLILKAVNEGSREAFPKLTIDNVTENGYVGIATAMGTTQLGYYDATVKGTAEKNGQTHEERLLNIRLDHRDDFAQFKDIRSELKDRNRYPWSDYVSSSETGTLEFMAPKEGFNQPYHYGLMLNGDVSTTVDDWSVVSYAVDIPQDTNGEVGAKNWRADMNLVCFSSRPGQTGVLNIAFCDEFNEAIAVVDIAKEDKAGWDMDCKLRTNNTVFEHIHFEPNDGHGNNPKRNIGFAPDRGDFAIVKEGAKLTFYYAGQAHTFTEPLQEHRICKRIIVSIGDRIPGGQPNTAPFMDILQLRSLSFNKLNVDSYRYSPNRFPAGSRIEVDNENVRTQFIQNPLLDSVGINGADFVNPGSEYFYLLPGENEIRLMFSPWIEKIPNVELTWTENYM